MSATIQNSRPLVVGLLGEADRPEFQEAAALVRATSVCATRSQLPPEVVLFAQTRPGEIVYREIRSLQQRWPLAGFAAILGSWCEGETRTGRPWPGVRRFYWYEFAAWWNEQLALRDAENCPEWSRPTTDLLRLCPTRKLSHSGENLRHGVITLGTSQRYTADALSDVLHSAGFASVWRRPGPPSSIVRGTVAGIWDGGQLDDREAEGLAGFCQACSQQAAPVIALLDFPRRDRYELAHQLGAAAVFAKPWINAELTTTIEALTTGRHSGATAPRRRAA